MEGEMIFLEGLGYLVRGKNIVKHESHLIFLAESITHRKFLFYQVLKNFEDDTYVVYELIEKDYNQLNDNPMSFNELMLKDYSNYYRVSFNDIKETVDINYIHN